jgi:aldehyde dehydrogenase (NAD+)
MTENMMMTSSRASIDDRFLIGGHWVPPADPASRYYAADPSPGDADAAVAAARRAFDTGPWPAMSVAERAKYLGDFCDRFEQSLSEFNAAWTAESGAPIRHAARLGGNVVLLWRDLLNRASQLVLCERRALPGGDVDVLREPAGVAVIISAWNAPALYLAMKLVPALLAGCD